MYETSRLRDSEPPEENVVWDWPRIVEVEIRT
jgi:hypothetical protein